MSKTFDFKKVVCIVGGHIVSGYGDGDDVISTAFNSESFTRDSGAGGEQVRVKSNDDSGTISITLKASSLSNGVFQGFATADKVNNGGKVPITITDKNGTELAACELAWIQKEPDRSYGNASGDRTWVFETGKLVYTGGGIPEDEADPVA